MSRFLALLLLAVPVPGVAAVSSAPDPTFIRDQIAALAPAGSVTHVDATTGSVVVKLGGKPSDRFLSAAAEARGRVRVERAAPVVPLVELRGGMGITSPGASCTAGLVLSHPIGLRYVVTAGHCLMQGGTVWYASGALIGPPAYHTFPGEDYGAIVLPYNTQVTTGKTLVLYRGGAYRVLRTNDPVVGQYVCKSGAVTGVTCGTVLATDVTVTYHDGTVHGLIEVSACARAGDSGSPLFRDPGDQRLIGMGILSGGNGFACDDPAARTYYNPLTEIMTAYGLSLIK